MKNKKAFTLIELVFIIVIIGVLASIAVPKFNKMDDTAKINAEISGMREVENALEWVSASYKDILNSGYRGGKDGDMNTFDVDDDGKEEEFGEGMLLTLHSDYKNSKFKSKSFMDMSRKYAIFNDKGSIFSKVVKNGKVFRVIAYINGSENGLNVNGRGDDSTSYDVIAVTAQASSRFAGVAESQTNGDFKGRPDNNDFWIYNGTPYPIDINASQEGVIISDNHKNIPSGGLVLIDINGSKPKYVRSLRNIKVKISNSSNTQEVYFRELVQDGFN